MDALQRIKAVYDYSRHQRIALEEQRNAEKKSKENHLLFMVLIAVLLIAIYTWRAWLRKKEKYAIHLEEMRNDLEMQKAKLQEMHVQKSDAEMLMREKEQTIVRQKNDIDTLVCHEAELRTLINNKEKTIGKQADELKTLRLQEEDLHLFIKEKQDGITLKEKELGDSKRRCQLLEEQIAEMVRKVDTLQLQVEVKQNKSSQSVITERAFEEYPIYKKLHNRSLPCKPLKEEEWSQIEKMIQEVLPGFYHFLMVDRHSFSNKEYQLCLLLRLHVRMKDAGCFMDTTKAYVSRISTDILAKRFNEEGSGKALQKKLEHIF